MKQKKRKNSGTVSVVSIVPSMIIIALIVLTIVRACWFVTANDHYDKMISAYISQMKDYKTEDQDKLKKRLLEDGIFTKIHRWDKESFVKDKQLYNEMIKKYNERQREKEEAASGFIDDMINL